MVCVTHDADRVSSLLACAAEARAPRPVLVLPSLADAALESTPAWLIDFDSAPSSRRKRDAGPRVMEMIGAIRAVRRTVPIWIGMTTLDPAQFDGYAAQNARAMALPLGNAQALRLFELAEAYERAPLSHLAYAVRRSAEGLTPHEARYVAAYLSGWREPALRAHLGISLTTAESRRSRIRRAIGASLDQLLEERLREWAMFHDGPPPWPCSRAESD